jgi:hypothetical protein
MILLSTFILLGPSHKLAKFPGQILLSFAYMLIGENNFSNKASFLPKGSLIFLVIKPSKYSATSVNVGKSFALIFAKSLLLVIPLFL